MPEPQLDRSREVVQLVVTAGVGHRQVDFTPAGVERGDLHVLHGDTANTGDGALQVCGAGGGRRAGEAEAERGGRETDDGDRGHPATEGRPGHD
jgi:hypothetical protein